MSGVSLRGRRLLAGAIYFPRRGPKIRTARSAKVLNRTPSTNHTKGFLPLDRAASAGSRAPKLSSQSKPAKLSYLENDNTAALAMISEKTTRSVLNAQFGIGGSKLIYLKSIEQTCSIRGRIKRQRNSKSLHLEYPFSNLSQANMPAEVSS